MEIVELYVGGSQKVWQTLLGLSGVNALRDLVRGVGLDRITDSGQGDLFRSGGILIYG